MQDTNAFPLGFLEPTGMWEDSQVSWVEEVAAARQEVSLALHERETVPKMTGTTDALKFSTGKATGITDVHI